ncbi:MAG TPA: hypothetical protein VGO50_13015 [Pyrinomonadaceae bacterium]|jgi:hypothetical protein|nr:hypothetical protein [Pyrinomonadaceae bacterium]
MTAATGVVNPILAMTGAEIKAIAEIVGEETTGALITAAITGGHITAEIMGIMPRRIIREPITRQTIT